MAIPSRIILYQSNDQTIEIDRLKDRLTGSYLNSATATATLYDSSGNAVTGLNGLALAYVTSSNGKYRGNVEESFAPALGDNYEIWFEGNQGSSYFHLEIPVSIQARRT